MTDLHYDEYVIRCKTCGQPIAAFADDYLQRRQNMTIQEALDSLQLMNPCCRIAMMNPTVVNYNMENRRVIEGFTAVNIDVRPGETVDPGLVAQPEFPSCIGTATVEATAPAPAGTVETVEALPLPRLRRSNPVVTKPVEPVNEIMKQAVTTWGTAVAGELTREYQLPTLPGVPVLNIDPALPSRYAELGAGKKCRIATGRTWLCR